MQHLHLSIPLSLLFFSLSAKPVLAQAEYPPGITIGPGCTLTVGEGASVTVESGDVHVLEGGTLLNNGDLYIGRDFIVDGALQTTIGGTAAAPLHGRIHVFGEAEYHGSLAVALARGAHFQGEHDFTLATYENGFGRLAANQMPGARWSSNHYDRELVVSIRDVDGNISEDFAIEVDAAAYGEGEVLIDWVAHFDSRTDFYAVERFDEDLGWLQRGEVARVAGDPAAAYYSTLDQDLPRGQDLIRYRIRLEDDSGYWNYSQEVLVGVGKTNELRVFPNPVTDNYVRIFGIDDTRNLTAIRLVDINGRIVKDYPIPDGTLTVLDIPTTTPAGPYAVQLAYDSGKVQAAQLIIIRE